MTAVEAFDQASLEAFTSGLVAAGFEPEPGTEGSVWKGPIHPAFVGLTDATRMRIILRDGWPFVFPVALVDGLHSHHLNLNGYVCMWQDGDISGDWLTVEGFFSRASEWCEEARSGWDARGLGRDAYLNFARKLRAVATFNLDELKVGAAGTWGEFHARRRPPRIDLAAGRGGNDDLRGLWFHVADVEVPPRDLDELRAALDGAQRRGLDRALAKRRPGPPLSPSSSVDLVLFRWDRNKVRHLLVLAVADDDNGTYLIALEEGPVDEASLLLRAGPDAPVLRDKSVVIFGAGALGGHTAVCLGSSGVGRLRLVDRDDLVPGNVVRHVAGHASTGEPKGDAVKAIVGEHAPWTDVHVVDEKPHVPSRLRELVEDMDLVLDATGTPAVTASLAAVTAEAGKPFVSVGLYRGGLVARVQRQGLPGDTPLGARAGDDNYPPIPPGGEEADLVEPAVGCSAPVNNAPPSSVLACSATTAQAAIDVLTGRHGLPDELIDVYRPLVGEAPFDCAGRLTSA